jgi:hypothetical protein
VVRERSAKPLCVGSIPTRASNPPLASAQPYGKQGECNGGFFFASYIPKRLSCLALRSLFYSHGSQFNSEAAVTVGIVDPGDDRWFVEFNHEIRSVPK